MTRDEMVTYLVREMAHRTGDEAQALATYEPMMDADIEAEYTALKTAEF